MIYSAIQSMTRHVVRPLVAAIAAVCNTLIAAPLHAQYRYDAPKSRVEVLGLERWTPKMLKDSIAKYSPGTELHDAACMATLRYKLGFRDAMVTHYLEWQKKSDGTTRDFLAIRLIEPRSTTVPGWRTLKTDDFASLIPDYGTLVLPVTDSAGGVSWSRSLFSLQFSDSTVRARVMEGGPQSMRDDDARVRAYLTAHATPRDRRIAISTLDSNGFWTNRVAAAVTLANFSDDSARYALVRAMRDPHETVRRAAQTVLRASPSGRVDWRPVATDLHALLAGANVGAIDDVMTLLTRTGIDASMASALLDGNTTWIARLLDSESPRGAETVTAFLAKVAPSVAAGTDRAKWRAYLAERQRRVAPATVKRATATSATSSSTASARTSQK